MNTLKSGTTIVVLLGVLYGVYVVLSKPDRLRELKLPGATSSAKQGAETDPGPQIEFGHAGHAGHDHAESHLAVEAGPPKGLGFESGSPVSPSVSPPLTTARTETSPASVSPASSSAAGSGSGYGAANSGASSYGQPNSAPSSYGQSAYGTGPAAAPSGSSAAGYGGGSRYGVTSGASNSLSDGSSASTYGANSGNVYQASSQEPPTGYGSQPPVQPAYGVTPNTSSMIAPATVPESSAQVTSNALTEYSLRQMWASAEQLVAADKLKEALAVLSSHYSNPSLPSEHRTAMVPWLDALAARVIYSKHHLLEMPYEARSKETLFDIQERFSIPWQLLQNINSDVVTDPQVLVVGTPLKVMKGPFRADVELSRNEITVYLGELYAGRFPFTVGNEPPQRGAYKVVDKRLDRVYYGADGRTIPAGDPTNPYGGIWMDLGREVSIHGSPIQSGATETLGCISLSPQDAKDLYSILSPSSEVVIR